MAQAGKMMAALRQTRQNQTTKTGGSDKAYRAALRNQRRNQARQAAMPDTKGDAEEDEEGKETDDNKNNSQKKGSDEKIKKETGDTKKKMKGLSITEQYTCVVHIIRLYYYKLNL